MKRDEEEEEEEEEEGRVWGAKSACVLQKFTRLHLRFFSHKGEGFCRSVFQGIFLKSSALGIWGGQYLSVVVVYSITSCHNMNVAYHQYCNEIGNQKHKEGL